MFYTWLLIIAVLMGSYVFLAFFTPVVDMVYDNVLNVIDLAVEQGVLSQSEQLQTTLTILDYGRTVIKMVPLGIMVSLLIYGILRAMKREPEYETYYVG